MPFKQHNYTDFRQYAKIDKTAWWKDPKARSMVMNTNFTQAQQALAIRQLLAINKRYEASHGLSGKRALRAFPIATTIQDID